MLSAAIAFFLMTSVFAEETVFSQHHHHYHQEQPLYHFSQETVEGGSSKFRLLRPDGRAASYSDALQLLEGRDASFRQLLTRVLQEQQRQVPAYFWECPPFSDSTLDLVNFEFVILPAEVLLTRRPDRKSFGEKFLQGAGRGEAVVAFPSLGGDAVLVAPVPQEGTADETYMHLATFMHAADAQQIDALWQTVAQTIRTQLKATGATVGSKSEIESGREKKMWLSTSGAGVQWLHVRLDSRPKYYNWLEYK